MTFLITPFFTVFFWVVVCHGPRPAFPFRSSPRDVPLYIVGCASLKPPLVLHASYFSLIRLILLDRSLHNTKHQTKLSVHLSASSFVSVSLFYCSTTSVRSLLMIPVTSPLASPHHIGNHPRTNNIYQTHAKLSTMFTTRDSSRKRSHASSVAGDGPASRTRSRSRSISSHVSSASRPGAFPASSPPERPPEAEASGGIVTPP
jgi:hypothetical protein